jgi:hypothetical protein
MLREVSPLSGHAVRPHSALYDERIRLPRIPGEEQIRTEEETFI